MKLNYIKVNFNGKVVISDVDVIELPEAYEIINAEEEIIRPLIKKEEIDKFLDGFIFTFNIEKAKDLLVDIKRKELATENRRYKEETMKITNTLLQLI